MEKNKDYKEISYQDKTYLDKRRILRQLSTKDEIKCYLDIMSDKILEKILSSEECELFSELELYYYIKALLIDGYLAFEKIFENDEIIDLKMIDPVTLSPVDGEKWAQYINDPMKKRILFENQIIYMIYSEDEITSYIEEMKESYEQTRRLENELMSSRFNLPGDISKNIDRKVTFKELKRADKKLKFMSKVPKSILENEEMNSNDIRYNKFINKIYDIFVTQLFNKL